MTLCVTPVYLSDHHINDVHSFGSEIYETNVHSV